jgi:hypothetical protein
VSEIERLSLALLEVLARVDDGLAAVGKRTRVPATEATNWLLDIRQAVIAGAAEAEA